jgi:hypothetical protein
VGSAITLLATAIGIVVGQVLRLLEIATDGAEQGMFSLLSSSIAYISLAIAGMATGLTPGGVLGVAALVSSIATSAYTLDLWVDFFKSRC